MKTIKLLLVCLSVTGVAMGAALDVWTDTLNNTIYPSQVSDVETTEFAQSGLSVNTTGGKDFLVLSSFTTANNATEVNRQGRWQIASDYSGGNYTYSQASSVGGSAIYERWINGKEAIGGVNEYGSINMNGIYNFASAGSHSFDLYHRTNAGNDLNTQNGTMVVVGLNVAGTTLRHATTRQDTSISSTGPTPYMSDATSASWSTVKQSSGGSDLAATVDVSEHGGEIFVAASMNCTKIGTDDSLNVAGEWQLVLYDSEGSEVERLGTSISREVFRLDRDKGAAMLYATTSDLPSGTYTVKIEQKVDADSVTAGRGVTTFNATINAVALTLQDGDEAGQHFESFSVGNTATESNDTLDYQRAVEEEGFTIAEDQGLILAANFTTSGDAAQTGDLEISLYEENGSTSVYDSMETLRSVGDTGSLGAGGVIGYDLLSAGTYDATLNFRSDQNTFSIADASLVGFSTVSVPEPTTVSLFALTAGLAIFFRRHFCC